MAMAEEQPLAGRRRFVRTVTFWLRPEFVLRVVNRFQKVAGFDRAVALASGALTATIPLLIVASSAASQLGGKSTADRIIDRYELTGGGAEAVRDVFSPPAGVSTSLGVMGILFLLIALLSFTRGVQRMFEQTWELEPMSVRNTANGLLWITGLAGYLTVTGALHSLLGVGRLELAAAILSTPLAAVFLIWSGGILSARRLQRHDVIPFGLLGATALGIYSIGATVYVPHLFSSYASRYGVIGAVFAMISAFFIIMVILVASCSAGREIRDELDRIARGERPAENEVRRQWDELTAEARLRWDTARVQVKERRRRRHAE